MPGRAAEAEALWYDPHRWPAWVDGFGHVVRSRASGPRRGARARVAVPARRPRARAASASSPTRRAPGRRVEVEDATMTGRQTVAFEPGPDAVEVTLSLEYEIKDRTPLTPVVDLLFVRRAMTDALRRTRHALRQRAQGGDPVRLSRRSSRVRPMFVFKAAVVGAGVMGGEIAQVIAAADIPVLLKDVDQKFVDAGPAEGPRGDRGPGRQARRQGEAHGRAGRRAGRAHARR